MEKPPSGGALRTELSFAYRLYRPQQASGEVLILLHGSGVDETTIAPLAEEIAPRSLRISVRGRVPQEDGWRWFERITPVRFEQASIRTEVDAFAAFAVRLAADHGFELRSAVFLGYSNGANVISSLILTHPGLIRRAALLRAMPVLDDVPPSDLSGSDVLVISGERDETYGRFAPALAELLRGHGANATARVVAAGHEFGAQDAALVRNWLAAAGTIA
jgi:phospholipase/carboxylesterase